MERISNHLYMGNPEWPSLQTEALPHGLQITDREKNWFQEAGVTIMPMGNGLSGIWLAPDREVVFTYKKKDYQLPPGKIVPLPERILKIYRDPGIGSGNILYLRYVNSGKKHWYQADAEDMVLKSVPKTLSAEEKKEREEKIRSATKVALGTAWVLVVNATNTERTPLIVRSAKGVTGAMAGEIAADLAMDSRTGPQKNELPIKTLDPNKIPYWTGKE